MPEVGRTIAADPDVIPLGSTVLIDGHEYIAEDTGVIGRVIDLYVGTEAQSEVFGVREMEVYVKEENR